MTELKELGINRVSFGPYVFRACLGRFAHILDELTHMNGQTCFTPDALSGTDIEPYLNKEREV